MEIDSKENTGLKINGKRITHLSGVHSSIYLVPKMDEFMSVKKANLDLPLLLLLGDHEAALHFTFQGMMCSCEKGNTVT